MTGRAPGWLASFQAEFARALCLPLDRSTGRLQARTDEYPTEWLSRARGSSRVTACERVAVYNRQYWFRLFTALHGSYPLTARLFGFWEFNAVGARFFQNHRPKSWDIDDVASGFEQFLAAELSTSSETRSGHGPELPERAALVEAADIDAAHHEVLRAPHVEAYRPVALSVGELSKLHLHPSPHWRIVVEHWPLVELRRELLRDSAEHRVPLPAARPSGAQHWLVIRKHTAVGQLPLGPREVQLFEALGAAPLGEALATLEATCPEPDRADLPAWLQRWLGRSMELEMWTTAEPP